MLLNCRFGETIESPLDCKEIKPAHPKGNQSLNIHRKDWCWSWSSNTLVTWGEELTHWKRPCSVAGKDWRQEEKGTTEDEMVRWHHWLDGHEFEQAPGVSDGPGSLVCCSPWGAESDMTERLNWTERIEIELRVSRCTIEASWGLEWPLRQEVSLGDNWSALGWALCVCSFMSWTDCKPSGSSVHGISQKRILERVTISSFRRSCQARDQTPVSCVSWITSGFFTAVPPGKS